jgi:hypothetical protein
MAKFDVTFYYHTSVTVEVEAENEEEALELAEMEVDDEKYNEQILGNLDEDNNPDVTPA